MWEAPFVGGPRPRPTRPRPKEGPDWTLGLGIGHWD